MVVIQSFYLLFVLQPHVYPPAGLRIHTLLQETLNPARRTRHVPLCLLVFFIIKEMGGCRLPLKAVQTLDFPAQEQQLERAGGNTQINRSVYVQQEDKFLAHIDAAVLSKHMQRYCTSTNGAAVGRTLSCIIYIHGDLCEEPCST